jgi:serine/threonine protein kinase
MAAPNNPQEFLDLLQQSSLLEEGDLERCRDLAGQTSSAEELAEVLVRSGLLTPFHSTNLLRGRWRGFFLGKYKLLEQLGAGGMGQVFLATHQMMRRLVALKVLTLRPGADPSILPRFQREARAMAALDHPNIVHAYDCDQDDKLHYIVLEYVDGISLSELVKKRGPVTVERAVTYIYQAALGLQHAHEAGLVHRDIKPGNMLLDRQGVVKILDMGLARLFHDNADNLTLEHNAGRALGTADYLAPEQATNSHDVDIRADIYSLGASLYYLLTGKAPFQGATVAQKLLLHQLKPPTPLHELCPEVPEELEVVINRMMAKQPEQRHATADEVCAALEPWAAPMDPLPEGEIPRPCPAVIQLIQQYMPPTSRKNSSGLIRRPNARATAVVPALAAAQAEPAPAARQAGRPSSPPELPPLPQPAHREQLDALHRLGETPVGSSLFPTEPGRLGRQRSASPPASSTPAPAVKPTALPPATTEALFGNWMAETSPKGQPKKTWLRRWWSVLLLVGMVLAGGVAGVAGNFFLQGSPRNDPGSSNRPLTPAEAANHVDEQSTVEMRVRSVGSVRGGPAVIYLNSEADWRTRGNFSVLLDSATVERLRQEGVEDFVAHFKDHKVRATGTIQLYKDRALKQHRLQMVIEDPTSLQVEP